MNKQSTNLSASGEPFSHRRHEHVAAVYAVTGAFVMNLLIAITMNKAAAVFVVIGVTGIY